MVSVNELAVADILTLGVVKVWGVTNQVTRVTMKVAENPEVVLGFTYKPEVRCFMQTYTLNQLYTVHIVRTIDFMRNGTFYMDKRCCLKNTNHLF